MLLKVTELTECACSSANSVYIHLSPHSHLEAASELTVLCCRYVNSSAGVVRGVLCLTQGQTVQGTGFHFSNPYFSSQPIILHWQHPQAPFSDFTQNTSRTKQLVMSWILHADYITI